jgi:hypothetical protein
MADGEVTPSQAMVLLDTMEEGRFRRTLDESLEEMVERLHKHQLDAGGVAKGRLTIALAVQYDGTHVMIAGEVATKLPKPVRGRSLFFRTPDNGLSTQHPKQLNLPLTDVTVGDEPKVKVMP